MLADCYPVSSNNQSTRLLDIFFVSGRCFFFFVSKPTAYSPSHAPLYTNRYIYQGVHNIVVVDVMSLRVLSPFNDSLNFILL